MSKRTKVDNRHQGNGVEAREVPLISIDQSYVVGGYITSGSSVYVDREGSNGLPGFGRSFVARFDEENSARYFNASQIGSNAKRVTLQLGKERTSEYEGRC